MLPADSDSTRRRRRRRHTHTHHSNPSNPRTNLTEADPFITFDANDFRPVPSRFENLVRTFSVPNSIRSSFHSHHLPNPPSPSNLPDDQNNDDTNNPHHHHHHHHHHEHDDSKAISYELILYLKYLLIYVIIEFLLIYLNLLEFTDLFFILVILKSTYDDLAYGPRCDKIHTLKEKIYLLSKILLFLFAAVFFSGCFTDQFVEDEPVELQIENDENEKDDGSPPIGPDDILQIWNWIYRGFRTVVLVGGDGLPTIDWHETGLFAGIHVVVCASKLAVVRFLLLEWELTVKSISRFVTTL